MQLLQGLTALAFAFCACAVPFAAVPPSAPVSVPVLVVCLLGESCILHAAVQGQAHVHRCLLQHPLVGALLDLQAVQAQHCQQQAGSSGERMVW